MACRPQRPKKLLMFELLDPGKRYESLYPVENIYWDDRVNFIMLVENYVEKPIPDLNNNLEILELKQRSGKMTR